jgi:hypothetical protein
VDGHQNSGAWPEVSLEVLLHERFQWAKFIDALSLRTRESLEPSNTTPLMVTSLDDEWVGPGPDTGRTALDELDFEVGLTLKVWYPERTYVLDDGGLCEGLT